MLRPLPVQEGYQIIQRYAELCLENVHELRVKQGLSGGCFKNQR